jgi:hypothetical protein
MENNNDKKFVFRLQDENNGQHDLKNTIKDWDDSRIFDDKQISAIKSSNIHSEHEPTSIPSPFARIALVKTAFGEVAEYGEKALAAYQKIVSDSLDVAEIFFTFGKWENQIEIIKWDLGRSENIPFEKDEFNKGDLKALEKHTVFCKSLKTFLKNDAATYNFDKMQALYILKHKNTGKMLGATSPCTLFFNTANKVKVDIELSNGNKAFQNIFPLHKRSWDFQKYLYTWIKINNETRQIDNHPVYIFDEFAKYLEKQKPQTNKIDEIDNHLPLNFDNYEELRAPDVEILGKPLHKAGTEIDFNYLSKYDLLTDKLIRLPYKIQKDYFFDGNLNDTSKYSYLLPVSDVFFKYKSVEDLQKYIRINENGTGGSVTVQLNIPGLQQEIKREYREKESIIELVKDFDCMLLPNVKFARKEDAYYRFGLFLPYESKDQFEKYSVEFYNCDDPVILEKPIIRNANDAKNPICKTYLLNQTNFDRVKITNDNISGVLLPILPEKYVSETFTFAVDLGTTNTHIEYKTDTNNIIRPFDIQENCKQVCFLMGNNPDKNKNITVSDVDFLPSLIGEGKYYKFPVRTALSLVKNKENAKKVFPFAHANVVIPYEKRRMLKYNRLISQLKWDSTMAEMGYYIDSLCFMLRNKVVLNGGNLAETKIVWFYPLSMAGTRSKIIRDCWNVAYANYFLGFNVESFDNLDESSKVVLKRNVVELPESIAPFLCYKDDSEYKDAINNLVSIDIGGGTTDIVFIKDKKTEYVTSFRFAANSIFGLGENITPIVSKYQSEIEQIVKDNDPYFDLQDILRDINYSEKGDLASFFFSLSDNELLKNVDINFNSMLKKDNDQKLVFVLFYAAIIYHSAQILKAKQLQSKEKLHLPRHITFSGNGSRIINIIGDKEVLAELSKLIFEKVFVQLYGKSGLDIIQNTKNPKEVTCKGGIKAAARDYVQTPFEPVVLLGTDDKTFATDSDTYFSVNVNESVAKTNTQVKEFVYYVLDDLLKQKYTKGVVAEIFVKALNINQKTLQIAKDVIERDEDIINFTRNGINEKIESISDSANTQIEETFFFYPIASLLNAISNEINRHDRV